MFVRVFYIVETLIIVYVAAINCIYLLLVVMGFFALERREPVPRHERDALLKSPLLPPVAILAPAYNEALTCRDSVRAMIGLRYPNHEVIVINDGSTDDTLQILIDSFKLYRSGRTPTGNLATKPIHAIYESRDPIRLLVIDKENGGKADSLNAGINVARAPLVCAVDSDSLIEEEALLYVVEPFLDDETTVATGGIIRVANGCRVEGGRVVRFGPDVVPEHEPGVVERSPDRLPQLVVPVFRRRWCDREVRGAKAFARRALDLRDRGRRREQRDGRGRDVPG